MTLVWTPNAQQELADAYEYISLEHPNAALKLVQRLLQAAEHLVSYPYFGKLGRVSGSREFVVAGTSYILAYGVTDQSIVIFAVRHGARLWPDNFSSDSS